MFDLFLLSLPPALGYAVYFSVLAPLKGFESERWNPSPGPGAPLWKEIIEKTREGPSDEEIALWAACQQEARRDAVSMAVRALDTLPDASPDSIAEALGLPPVLVRTRSVKGRRVRNLGKRGDKTADYSPAQVMAAATGNSDCHVDW